LGQTRQSHTERPDRPNLAERQSDRWRPPALEPGRTPLGRFFAGLRRFFDLQAGSVWNDVAATVASARGKVVDVGCGAQPYRALLPAGTSYVGLDVDEAEAHFGYAVPDTIQFDGGRWPEATHDADFVLCTEALEHVLDPGALLAEAHAALRPGGRLLLTVPFAARWHFVPHDYWRFTPSSLKHLLSEAGFADVVVWARGNEVTVACYKVMALLLPLLMPQGAPPAKAVALRLLGLPTVPLFVGLAAVANLSLRGRGGDDCLGYTVTAVRPAAAAAS
jgi:SAM-dependent methyltransferase